jgi:hypothetical protein
MISALGMWRRARSRGLLWVSKAVLLNRSATSETLSVVAQIPAVEQWTSRHSHYVPCMDGARGARGI